MKEIKINHHKTGMLLPTVISAFVYYSIAFAIIGVVSENAVNKGNEELYTFLCVLGFFAGLFVLCAVISYFDAAKATVRYDSEKLHFKKFGSEQTVKFADVKTLYYTVYKENTGKGHYNNRLELCFKLENDEFCLNDKISTEDIADCVSGNADNLPLMELYDFISENCPEKAVGYRKQGTIW